ncbi:MAG: hypothetical protein ABJA98_29760 [Acidobacteriota bacterium]
MSVGSLHSRGTAFLLVWAVEVAALAVIPVAAVFGLGISVVDQFGSADPAYYTGYGLSFERMWHAFGLTYYAARFPVIGLNAWSQTVSPGLSGYTMVRVLVFLMCAAPLYLLSRRLYGPLVAMAAYAFLVLNPLFPRVLCWDLTTFLSIPAALGGIVLWYLSAGSWSPIVLLSGFLFGVSINSHVFTATAIGVFLAVEAAFALRRPGGIEWFACRLVTAGAGVLACVALGLLYYSSHVGYVAPQQLWNITLVALRMGQQYVSVHFFPFSSYYAVNYEIYIPVFTTLLVVALNGRRLLEDSIEARISGFAVAYLSMYLVAVFGLHMNIVQYFWYFGHLTIVVYLSVPVILGRFAERAGTSVALVFVAGLLGVAVLVAQDFNAARRMSIAASGSAPTVMAVCGAMLLCVLAVFWRRRLAYLVAVAAIAVVLQVPFLSATHLSLYDRVANRNEKPLFAAIQQFHALMNRYEKPGQRLMLWYPSGFPALSPALLSLASSDLLYDLQDPFTPAAFPLFGAAEQKKLDDPSVRFLLLMGEDPATLDDGLRALDAVPVSYSILGEETWGYDPLIVHARLVDLRPSTTR